MKLNCGEECDTSINFHRISLEENKHQFKKMEAFFINTYNLSLALKV